MSIDSMFVHKMWDDHELSKMVDGGVPFPMLSDAGGKVGKLFGVFNEGPVWKTGAGSLSIRMACARATRS
jgi:alkyl hydroperoxide reductase subunit AhpC